jgi:hypothetical protein
MSSFNALIHKKSSMKFKNQKPTISTKTLLIICNNEYICYLLTRKYFQTDTMFLIDLKFEFAQLHNFFKRHFIKGTRNANMARPNIYIFFLEKTIFYVRNVVNSILFLRVSQLNFKMRFHKKRGYYSILNDSYCNECWFCYNIFFN